MTVADRAKALGLAMAMVVLFALAVVTSAQAAKEYELNDTKDTAYGPLAGSTWYTATIETENDVDWYLFYIRTYSQMDFSATALSGSCVPILTLYNKDGRQINDFVGGPVNETRHLLLTMDPGRYYLEVDSCTSTQYKFRIDPAASITTSRECGEAIVARDAVGPQLAAVNKDLADNAAVLAGRAQAVHEAKAELRQASSKAKRLRGRLRGLRSLRKRRRVRAKLRQARSGVQRATEQLDEAKEERRPVWQEKRDLEAVAQQHNQQISTANGQIAAFC